MAATTIIKVAPSSLGLYERKLAGRYKETVRAGLATGARAAVGHVTAVSRATVRDFDGHFNNGWAHRPIAWHSQRVFNPVKHAPYVEGGRRPGARMPPPAQLERWVSVRFGLPMGRVRGRGRGGKFQASPAYRVAILVARKIAIRGIPGKFVMRRARHGMVLRVYLALVMSLDTAIRKPR